MIHYTAGHDQRQTHVGLNQKSRDKLAKKCSFFFFDKNLAGKILLPRFSTNTFFLLFAYCFAYFCLRKTENPKENKVAANQNITCY